MDKAEKAVRKLVARSEKLRAQAEERRQELMQRAEESREELMRQAEARREELARRAETIRAEFSERVNAETVTSFAGWTLISTGIAWGVTDWLRGSRSMRSLVFPIAMIVMGTAVLSGNTAWQRRSAHISETEARLREELSGLGPFARARVIRDMAEETVPLVRKISFRNN